MKLFLIILLIYLLARKIVIVNIEPIKSDWTKLKNAVAWVKAKIQLIKSKFKKNSTNG